MDGLLSDKRLYALAEDLCVIVNVGFSGVRCDQGHIVEWRHQDAAIERGQVHVAAEFGVHSGGVAKIAL